MSANQMQAKGFFAALFDLSFTSFITLRFLRVIYAVLVGLILLGGVFFLIAALASGSPETALLGIVAVPLITLLHLVLARIYLELVALLFRIGENTSHMARALAGPGGWPGPGGPGVPLTPAGGSPHGETTPFASPQPPPSSPYAGPATPPSSPSPSPSPWASPTLPASGREPGAPAHRPYGEPEEGPSAPTEVRPLPPYGEPGPPRE